MDPQSQPPPANDDLSFISSIANLCTHFSISYSDLYILCNFCRTRLSSLECVFFDNAECKLLWKAGFPFAVCFYCLKLLARFEYIVFSRGCCTAKRAEEVFNRGLSTFTIRCVTCLRRLQSSEVQDICDKNSIVYLVGSKLRAKCHLCALGL